MTPRPALGWRWVCVGSLVVFLGLSAAAAGGGALPGDPALRDAVLGWASPGVTALAWWVNHGGSWRVLGPAALLLFALSREARRAWWLWGLALLLAPVIESAWKPLVGRPRPEGLGFGFPSGHATAAAVFGVTLVYLAGQAAAAARARTTLRSLALLGVLLVGLARIVLRAHWPSDVLGGWALGSACAAAGAWWLATRAPDDRPASGG